MCNHVLTSQNGETRFATHLLNTQMTDVLGFEALMCGGGIFFSVPTNMTEGTSLQQQTPCLLISSPLGCEALLPYTLAGLRCGRAPPGAPPTSLFLFNPVENCSHFLLRELRSQTQVDGSSQSGCDRQTASRHSRKLRRLHPR